MPDVFVSYSRKDRAFVEKLVTALAEKKRDVWVDFEDIPFAAEWWEEIQKGIESSESAIFVISPDYLASEVCGLEVNYVRKNNKRIIPIVVQRPERKTVPDTLAALNWIFFDNPDSFEDSFNKLQTTLSTNLVEMRQHTRLLVKASEWAKAAHTDSLLLRGEELDELYRLIKRDDINDLMRDFLQRSEERHRRDEMAQRFFWGLMGGLLSIAFWAFSTFRSDVLIDPIRLVYSIALGQVFGVCLGLLSMFADELPNRLQRWLGNSQALRLVLRSVLFTGISIFAWASYVWFLQRLSTTRQDTNSLLLGGVALALGFLIRSIAKLPAWVFTLVIAALIWLPVYITYQDNYTNFVPLIYFDVPEQVFTIGIPVALIMAIGANFRAVYRQAAIYYQQATARTAATASI
ncbi:MAG: TIR domain-containing protein [Chloroflexi bacterium]|nr:TIR domain-containing protein [Chloroflexota bacterium]MCC6896585.1 TIR domain-containing protein [Anaerolineae bacterium]